jgi:hypothetical protein
MITLPWVYGPEITTCWFMQVMWHHVVHAGHKVRSKIDHKVWCHLHLIEHDTQPIVFLISKQAIPYWSCGDTCCHGVSTPKIQSLADLSMTNHITRRISTVSTIPILLKPQYRSSPRSNNILTDGRPSLTKTQAKLYITKDRKTCTTLMTTWLSITNQIIKYEAEVIVLKHAGQCVY